jgi:hypothetical protein
MTSTTAMFLVIAGLILTAFGVGGIEVSENLDVALNSGFFAIIGLLIMYCGVLGLRNAHLYDKE